MPSNKIAVCLKPALPQSLWIHVFLPPVVWMTFFPWGPSRTVLVSWFTCLLACLFFFFMELWCHCLCLEHYDIPFNSGLKLCEEANRKSMSSKSVSCHFPVRLKQRHCENTTSTTRTSSEHPFKLIMSYNKQQKVDRLNKRNLQ